MRLLTEWRDVQVGTPVIDDDGTTREVSVIERSDPMADGRPAQLRVTADGVTRSVWPTSQVWVEVGGMDDLGE